MKTIISASRRTDIPAFYYNWLQNCLKEKKVIVNNPLYPEKIYTIDLEPENIHSIILWSKNFINVLKDPGLLENYNIYFQYTITGYNKKMEPNVPTYEESLKTLEGLLRKYNPKQFNIRFDPIIITLNGEVELIDNNPELSRLKIFERLCKDLKTLGMDDCRITVSYISFYGNTEEKLRKAGIEFIRLTEEEQINFFKRMSEIAQKFNRNIYTCANDRFIEAGITNIKKGHCIDGDILSELFGKCTKSKDSSQRLECGCVKSRDIGLYTQRCGHKCAYCYSSAC